MKLKHFREIVHRYKVVFLDSYGVIKNYKGAINGAAETFSYLKKHGIGYFILTNDASRSPEGLMKGLHNIGLTEIEPRHIISSGMLATEYLSYKYKSGSVVYLGAEGSAHYIESIGIRAISIRDVDLNDVDHVHALVLMDDEGFNWQEDINKVINLLRLRNIPVIVANSDKSYPVAKKEVSVAVGGIANLIEDISQRSFMYFGKPDAQMFIFAYQHIRQHYDVDKSDILMVGDTLSTDIIGGNKFGLDTALVLTGNTLPESYEHYIWTTGIIPTYVCQDISIT